MYLPKYFEETRIAVMHALIREFPFAALVCANGEGLTGNHIPFILDSDAGEFGTLRGHIARANPLWQQPAAANSLVIFQGPSAYISPNWYPGKFEDGKRVPTWAYAVTHAHGAIRFIHEPPWLLRLVSELSEIHEVWPQGDTEKQVSPQGDTEKQVSPQGDTEKQVEPKPWAVSDAPADYIERLLGAIVGIEIPIQKLEGKWKLDQNKSQIDQAGMLRGLNQSTRDNANVLGKLIARRELDAKLLETKQFTAI